MHRVAVRTTPERVRRRPKATALYQILQQHLETICARVGAATAGDTDHQALPTCAHGQPRAAFHAADELTDTEVASTVHHMRSRVLRLLHEADANHASDTQDPDVFATEG